jgi:sulfatase maturation enzyme AslB (radical SAM superfamily)
MPSPVLSQSVAHHVVFTAGLTEAVATALSARILESPSRYLAVDLRDPDLAAAGGSARVLADLLRDGCRSSGRQLSLSVFTNLDSISPDACDWLASPDLVLTFPFGGTAELHEASRVVTGAPSHDETLRCIRELHARHAARGATPETAYLNALVPVTRATAEARPTDVIDACRAAGLLYIQLQPLRPAAHPGPAAQALACTPDAYLAFYRDAVAEVLRVNESGALLVEKRLAMYLETLATIDPRRPPEPRASADSLVYGPDGRVYARPLGPVTGAGAIGHVDADSHESLARRALDVLRAEPRPQGCVECRYDRYCGSSLIRQYTLDEDEVTKSFGSAWCHGSMGTFDLIFERLRSTDGPALRRVQKRWAAARDAVAARLTSR